jgi:hypothetical protein
MNKLALVVAMVLLLTGVACTKERTIQTSSEVREKTSDSTRVAEAPAAQPQPEANRSTVETEKSTSRTLNADPSGSVQVEHEKKSTTTMAPAENTEAKKSTDPEGTVLSEEHSQKTTKVIE